MSKLCKCNKQLYINYEDNKIYEVFNEIFIRPNTKKNAGKKLAEQMQERAKQLVKEKPKK